MVREDVQGRTRRERELLKNHQGKERTEFRKGCERGEFILTNSGVQGSESETRSTTASTTTSTNYDSDPKKKKSGGWTTEGGRGAKIKGKLKIKKWMKIF